MTDTQRGILILIRSAITNESFNLPPDFSLEDAFQMCKKRSLVSLLYTGAVNCGISKQDPLMLQMFQSYFKYIMRSEKQMADANRVFAAFDDAGIDYMPLKGAHLKSLFPKPEFRMMGDVDVLIRQDQYDQIAALIAPLGFEYSSDTEHHYVWHSNHLSLELHESLIPESSKDYSTYYKSGWQLAVPDIGTRYTFRSPEDEFIFIFTHFARHYRFSGIGCRHVIDLWVFKRSYPDMDEAYILSVLDQLQLTEFYKNIMQLIRVWFENANTDEKTEFISDFIFASGNWGSIKNLALSSSVEDLQTTTRTKHYKFRKIMQLIFPSRHVLETRYPFVQKHPYLFPLFYPVRIFNAFVNKRKYVKRHASKLSVCTAENIQTYEESLEYVGLRFNYKNNVSA